MLFLTAKSWLTTYFILFFFTWGIFLPFWGVWLDAKGVTAEQIGTLFAIGLLLRFFSNFFLLPRLKSAAAAVKLICWLSFAIVLCLLLLAFQQTWWFLAVFTLLVNFLMGPMIPLGDIIATQLVNMIKLNYGQVRLWGSVSFIIGAACVGWAITQWGTETILWLILIVTLFIFLLSLVKLRPALTADKDLQDDQATSLFKLLKKPQIVYFVLTMGIIQGSHSGYYAFSALYWESAGISELHIALLWGIGVLAEVLLMQFNDKWFARWSIKQMTLLALLAALIRWLVLASTTALPILYFIQTFHAFTFALAHLAAMRFIALQSQQLVVNYQSLYSSISLGLAMAFFTYLSGWAYASMNAGVFLWMAVILLPAFITLNKWQTDK